MNKNVIRIMTIAGFIALTQGCSLKPQYLHLDPAVNAATANAPAGSGTIALSVEDSRSTTKLGEVGDPDRKMVDVSLEEDFRPVLYAKIADALTQRGFKVVPAGEDADRTLIVNVRRLELSSRKQPLTFDTELRAEVSAESRHGEDSYDKLFYVRTHKETAGPPYLKDSNALVNSAVSQSLEDLLSDEKLLEFLAR
ncbi:MAG TPA: YajG family lipoprotein [Burkholderiales bacterium]|nr:YajG family lipoprotein [Burkholderiales bacterium]